MLNFEKAVILAAQAHRDQRDYAGEPYLLHPLRLALKMKTDVGRVVAVLHDALEDDAPNRLDLDALNICQASPEICEALRLLTRNKGEAYTDYLQRCLSQPLAFAVKLVDIVDNSSYSRLQSVAARHGDVLAVRLAKKYTGALRYLRPQVAANIDALCQLVDLDYVMG